MDNKIIEFGKEYLDSFYEKFTPNLNKKVYDDLTRIMLNGSIKNILYLGGDDVFLSKTFARFCVNAGGYLINISINSDKLFSVLVADRSFFNIKASPLNEMCPKVLDKIIDTDLSGQKFDLIYLDTFKISENLSELISMYQKYLNKNSLFVIRGYDNFFDIEEAIINLDDPVYYNLEKEEVYYNSEYVHDGIYVLRSVDFELDNNEYPNIEEILDGVLDK